MDLHIVVLFILHIGTVFRWFALLALWSVIVYALFYSSLCILFDVHAKFPFCVAKMVLLLLSAYMQFHFGVCVRRSLLDVCFRRFSSWNALLCFALFVDSHNSTETRAAMLLMLMIWLFHIVARTVVQSCHPCSNEKNRDEKYILRQSAKLLCFGIVISLSHFGQPRAHYASIEHLANILCELCAFVSVSVWVDVCALVLLYAFLLNTCTLCVCVYTSCIRINRLVIRSTILYVQHTCVHRTSPFF